MYVYGICILTAMHQFGGKVSTCCSLDVECTLAMKANRQKSGMAIAIPAIPVAPGLLGIYYTLKCRVFLDQLMHVH